jgi:hypothetical protein
VKPSKVFNYIDQNMAKNALTGPMLENYVPTPSDDTTLMAFVIMSGSFSCIMVVLYVVHGVMTLMEHKNGVSSANHDQLKSVMNHVAFRVFQSLVVALVFVTIAFIYTTMVTTVCLNIDFGSVAQHEYSAGIAAGLAQFPMKDVLQDGANLEKVTGWASFRTIAILRMVGVRLDSDDWHTTTGEDITGVVGLLMLYGAITFAFFHDALYLQERSVLGDVQHKITKGLLVVFLFAQFGLSLVFYDDMETERIDQRKLCHESKDIENAGMMLLCASCLFGLLWSLIVVFRLVSKDGGTQTGTASMKNTPLKTIELLLIMLKMLTLPAALSVLYVGRTEYTSCMGMFHNQAIGSLANDNAAALSSVQLYGVPTGEDVLRAVRTLMETEKNLDDMADHSSVFFTLILLEFAFVWYITFIYRKAGKSGLSFG